MARFGEVGLRVVAFGTKVTCVAYKLKAYRFSSHKTCCLRVLLLTLNSVDKLV